jgi:hypothetical protein
MTRHPHFCWPYSAAGILRAGCTEHFAQPLPGTAVHPAVRTLRAVR